jgi:hypothetical protein
MLMMLASGCVTTYVSDYCLIASEPRYTAQDVDVISDELAMWLEQQQAQYRAVCGGNK